VIDKQNSSCQKNGTFAKPIEKAMSLSLFLIFNHNITPFQESDARSSLGVQQIINMPSDLKSLWEQIPSDMEKIDDYLFPIKDWLAQNSVINDYVLIQGDFGACYIMVKFAFKIGLVPIYSTTNREAVEQQSDDGTIKLVHHFRHQKFRQYGE
jgi:hypothetical protein